jgi:hypothetical protein
VCGLLRTDRSFMRLARFTRVCMKEPKAKKAKANARRGVRVGWEVRRLVTGFSKMNRCPRWIAPADLMHDAVWHRGPIVSPPVDDTSITRPATDARQQVQRRGRQAVREYRCRMRVLAGVLLSLKQGPRISSRGMLHFKDWQATRVRREERQTCSRPSYPALCWQGRPYY